MNIIPVAKDDEESIAAILRLWRPHSDTLGFMPEGAFAERAARGELLAGFDSDQHCLGYLMFRRTRATVAIVHLCVSPQARGGGVARQLFNALKDVAEGAYEIRVTCRRDFAASTLWPKLGFVAVGEKQGRAGVLTNWRCELACLPLLALMSTRVPSERIRVAIDANVFFDLDEGGFGYEESRSLLADWLAPHVELVITNELLNEIHRRDSADDRHRQRSRALALSLLGRNLVREEPLFEAAKNALQQANTPRGDSDARQLAMAAAADVTFFVTRDQGILDTADALEHALGLEVMAPHDLIRRFDRLQNEDEYQPKRLFLGPAIVSRRAQAEDVQALADLLHSGQPAPEPQRRTLGRLRDMLADPRRFPATCVEKDGALLCAYILDQRDAAVLDVPFFAVSNSSVGRTAARHYAEELVRTAAASGRRVVRVECATERVSAALLDLGFVAQGSGWVKLAPCVAMGLEDLANEVERMGTESPCAAVVADAFAAEIRSIAERPGVARVRAGQVERALWPAKALASALPCFVVPIRPAWAQELFDRELAAGTLFGAAPHLALNTENVYYKSAHPGIVTAPARILWYVSKAKDYPQSMAIRACSHVDEVVIGRPKDLFRRFRRLGVYEWRHVFDLAHRDLEHELMAFRFSRTELFRAPISFKAAQEFLVVSGAKRSQFQSPVAITEECFTMMYQSGTCVDAA